MTISSAALQPALSAPPTDIADKPCGRAAEPPAGDDSHARTRAAEAALPPPQPAVGATDSGAAERCARSCTVGCAASHHDSGDAVGDAGGSVVIVIGDSVDASEDLAAAEIHAVCTAML